MLGGYITIKKLYITGKKVYITGKKVYITGKNNVYFFLYRLSMGQHEIVHKFIKEQYSSLQFGANFGCPRPYLHCK